MAESTSSDPAAPASSTDPLREFLDVMRQLRRECAWKAEQTHASLVPYLREEAEEVVDAIETGDPDHLREELGDLLLQVYFHAVLAEEAGQFTLDDVARGIVDKMRRRNPHVFGELRGTDLTPSQVNEVWQRIKAEEKSAR